MAERPTEGRREDGRRLKAARVRRGLSQQDVADAVGVARLTVSRWERGASPVEHQHRATITRLLGVSADTVWSGDAALFLSPSSGPNPATQHQLALDAMELAGRLNDFARGVLQAEPTVQRVEPFAVVPAKPPTVAIPRDRKR